MCIRDSHYPENQNLRCIALVRRFAKARADSPGANQSNIRIGYFNRFLSLLSRLFADFIKEIWLLSLRGALMRHFFQIVLTNMRNPARINVKFIRNEPQR